MYLLTLDFKNIVLPTYIVQFEYSITMAAILAEFIEKDQACPGW